jgi:molybdopterin converting factor subunit 1
MSNFTRKIGNSGQALLILPSYMTMKFKVKAFGITRDVLGGREKVIEVQGKTVAALRSELTTSYPELAGLKSLLIAVNSTYVDDVTELRESDEIALIPPVSGG